LICKDCGSKNLGETRRQLGEQYFEYYGEKFWAIRYDDAPRGGYEVRTRFGKCWTNGTTTIKHFRLWAEAQRYMVSKKTEKLNKGYQETY